jgi:serralysin
MKGTAMRTSGITGTVGNNLIEGSHHDDFIQGLGGDDALYGYSGDDRIEGGNGNDKLNGGPGNDEIIDSYGQDTFIGGSGDDFMTGRNSLTEKNSLFNTSHGIDEFYGGQVNDTVIYTTNTRDFYIKTRSNGDIYVYNQSKSFGLFIDIDPEKDFLMARIDGDVENVNINGKQIKREGGFTPESILEDAGNQ